jgi:hypothetical protein
METKTKMISWLNTEKLKDKVDLEKDKSEIIKNIKQLKKEEIFDNKIKKLTLWQKLKKVLMGI